MTKKLYAHLLLDRSGSMQVIRDQTVSGVNEYLNKLRVTDSDTQKTVSLTLFDDISIDELWNQVDPSMAHLARDSFVPRGMTPLNDAIGKTVAKIDALGLSKDHLVALVIMTDGLENASKEHTKEAIKKKLESRQNDSNWLIIFLAANVDAFAEGSAQRGTYRGSTMSFSAQNVAATMDMAADVTTAYAASASNKAAAFSDEDRKRAMDPATAKEEEADAK